MKILRCFSIILALLSASCQSEQSVLEDFAEKESAGLVESKWKLIETLADIGDGKGTFQPTSFENTISFFKDGTFLSSVTLCHDASSITGTFDLTDGRLTPKGCEEFFPFRMSIENNIMIITPGGCIERCGQKYSRIDD
jgi:hypothetical protein